MAIRILRDWPSIIINVEKANKKLEGGLITLLANYYPPKEKTFLEKVKGIFSSSKPLTLTDFDNMHFSSGMTVLGGNGCDGNLYFFSYSNKDKINSYIKDLENKGLVSNRKSADCDFYIYDDSEKTAHPCKWLHLLMKEESASKECIVSSYAYLSIFPYRKPCTLQNGWQGDISFAGQYVWEEYQKFVQAGNAKGMKDLSDIQIRHLNARLWDQSIPSVDVFIKAYVDNDISKIGPKYRHILDGTKDRNEERQNIITFEEKPKVSEAQVSKVAPIPPKKACTNEAKAVKSETTTKPSMSIDISGKYFRVEQIVRKSFGEKLFLMPIDAGIVMNEYNELETIPMLAKDAEDFKKYLPGMDFSTKETTQAFFNRFVQLTEWGQEFGYTLRLGGLVCGFIFIHTPDYNKNSIGFSGWTIDFAIFPMFQRQHLMIGVLPHVLAFLKNELHVSSLYAIVDTDNYKCINLISKLCFDDTGKTLKNPNDNSTAKLYECPLSTINFQRR